MTHYGKQGEGARYADDEPDHHLDRELRSNDREVAVVLRGELDQPDHQGDADRIVHSRLALQDRARSSSNLTRSEDRERDGRIRWCDRRADESREDPVETEHVVGYERNEPGGDERPEHAKRENRAGRGAKPREPDVQASVEQDDHERDDCEPFDLSDRDDVLERRERLREECRGDEKERRVRKREPIGETHPEECDEHGRRHGEHDQSEVSDLCQRHATESTGGIGRTSCGRPACRFSWTGLCAANSLLTRISSRSHGAC